MRRIAAIAALAVIVPASVAPAVVAQAVVAQAAPDSAVDRSTEFEPLEMGPIVATFKQADFATYYRIDVTPGSTSDKIRVEWRLSPPKDDPGCKKFQQSASNPYAAAWRHGDGDGCGQAHHGGPRGHAGTVRVHVYDDVFSCRAEYSGTISGTGEDPECVNIALGAAIEGVTDALRFEEDALEEMRRGRNRPELIIRARIQLTAARGHAGVGGAPRGVASMLDEAIELDSAALKQARTAAMASLSDAIRLKEKILKLLRSAR